MFLAILALLISTGWSPTAWSAEYLLDQGETELIRLNEVTERVEIIRTEDTPNKVVLNLVYPIRKKYCTGRSSGTISIGGGHSDGGPVCAGHAYRQEDYVRSIRLDFARAKRLEPSERERFEITVRRPDLDKKKVELSTRALQADSQYVFQGKPWYALHKGMRIVFVRVGSAP